MEEQAMSVFAKLPSGRSVPLNIYNTDTVETAKNILSDVGGISVEEQELYYGDKPLSNEKTFADYNIRNESVILVKVKTVSSDNSNSSNSNNNNNNNNSNNNNNINNNNNTSINNNNNGDRNNSNNSNRSKSGSSGATPRHKQPAQPPPLPPAVQVWKVHQVHHSRIRSLLIALFSLVFNRFIENTLAYVFRTTRGIFTRIYEVFEPLVRALASFFGPHISSALRWVERTLSHIWTALVHATTKIANITTTASRNMWEVVKTTSAAINRPIKSLVLRLWADIKFVAMKLFSILKSILSYIWRPIRFLATHLWKGVRQVATKTWDAIEYVATNLWRGGKYITRKIWDPIEYIATNLWRGGKYVARKTWDGIEYVATNMWKGGKYVATDVLWKPVRYIVTQLWKGIEWTATNVVWKPLKYAGTTLWEAVEQLGTHVSKGIKWIAINVLWNPLKSIAENLWGAAKHVGTGVKWVAINVLWKPLKYASTNLWKASKYIATKGWSGIEWVATNVVWNPLKVVGTNLWRAMKYTTTKAWSGASWVAKNIFWKPTKYMGTHLWNATKQVGNALQRALAYVLRAAKVVVREAWRPIRFVLVTSYDVVHPVMRTSLRVLRMFAADVWRIVYSVYHAINSAATRLVFALWHQFYLVAGVHIHRLYKRAYHAMVQDCVYNTYSQYGLGISPGVTARKVPSRAIFVELENNTQFSIHLRNRSISRVVAVVEVDSVESGRFALEPLSTCYIERPINQQGRFTFVKNEGQDAEVELNEDTISAERGCVKVTFLPVGTPSRRLQNKRGGAKKSMMAWGDETEHDNSTHAERNATHAERNAEHAGPASTLRRRYVGGTTQLRGTSTQEVTALQWQGECQESMAVVLHAYLVASA